MWRTIPVALFLLSAVAVWGAYAKGPDSRTGMTIYKEHCKACHIAGGEGGTLTPISKTQAQWIRFFDKTGHKKKPSAWAEVPEQDLKIIRQWLHDHAADSNQPETCG